MEDGYEWCVDLDLEKFFDLVCHQRLTAKLAQRVSDRRLLGLIGGMLKAKVVLPDGVLIASEQAYPKAVNEQLLISRHMSSAGLCAAWPGSPAGKGG